MRIVCYFINFNDSFYLPFFHRHYSALCEKLIMYDQYSTDGSREMAAELGIEVRDFGKPGILNDQWYLDVKNKCWKECRGQGIDYVIVVDIDEFIQLEYFNRKGGRIYSPAEGYRYHPFPPVKGWNMISEHLPQTDMHEINTGARSDSYSKQAIFNPDFVEEINYVHGCHKHHAVIGKVPDFCLDDEVQLYHYRMIGGVDRLIDRHAMYRARMSSFNKQHKMGFHYQHPDHAKREEWTFLKSQATTLW